jgi:hypothetical protein
MPQTRVNVNLSTYLLYQEKDFKYSEELESHLELMLGKRDLGHLRGQDLKAFNLRDKGIKKMLEVPTCLLCLITPNFIHAIRQERFLWSELVRAHLAQQLLIVPILVEDCQPYRDRNLLRKIPGLLEQGQPLSVLRKQGDYATHLAQLTNACQTRMEQSLLHHVLVEKKWKDTQRFAETEEYEAFGEDFGYSKYGTEARRLQEELLEEEQWERAQAFDDIEHYLDYLTHTLLHKYWEQAVERIVQIEIDVEIAKAEVEKTNNIGMIFDHKSRFRETMDYELVQGKIDDLLGDIVRLYDGESRINSEAQFLKIKLFETCQPHEILTYNMLEEAANALMRKVDELQERRGDSKDDVKLIYIVITGILFVIAIGGAWVFSVLSWCWDHWFWGTFIALAFLMPLRNSLKYLKRELKTCEQVLKATARELIHLKLAFILRTDQTNCLRELYNMEEWAIDADRKNVIFFMLAQENKIEFLRHKLRRLSKFKSRKAKRGSN